MQSRITFFKTVFSCTELIYPTLRDPPIGHEGEGKSRMGVGGGVERPPSLPPPAHRVLRLQRGVARGRFSDAWYVKNEILILV